MSVASPKFTSLFQSALPSDPETENSARQVTKACYSSVNPQYAPAPSLVSYSRELASELGFTESFCESQQFVDVFVGNSLLAGSKPYAMCYGGHQFGNWAGQLGDGRAINLGEMSTRQNQLLSFQLKGAGPTPYSRFADGFAVLRSSIREFLCSEAMHHLGIPTTRALSLVLTGAQVERDMFYSGDPKMEPGAVVTRVAPSFIRFGNFELFAARGDVETLAQLVGYTVEYDFPHLLEEYKRDSVSAILQMLREVSERTCELIVHWMRVGFVHGVMNTDNMSILGLTIDYGPYGWLDNYDSSFTPNTTDFQNRRYRYENQAAVAQWNLLQLANALYPLINNASELESIVRGFRALYEEKWSAMMVNKLGLVSGSSENKDFLVQIGTLMEQSQIDMTLFYRGLMSIDETIMNKANDLEEFLIDLSYLDSFSAQDIHAWRCWFEKYFNQLHVGSYDKSVRQAAMAESNPVFILRNYLTQVAIEKAHEGDFSEVENLLLALATPYKINSAHETRLGKRPSWAEDKAGCSVLSCSS